MILSNRHNDFYIVDASEKNLRALRLSFLDGKITLKQFVKEDDSSNLDSFLKRLKPAKDSKIIFIYSKTAGATFAGQVKLEKNNHNLPLSEQDFDIFLNAASEQFFNRFREEAKRRLASDDINVVLANNRFLNFKLDGNAVISPLGLKGKFAELEMEQTFVERKLINQIHDNLPKAESIFHIELSGAIRDCITRLYPEEKTLLAIVKDDQTEVWTCGARPRYFGAVSFPKVQERGVFGWGNRRILNALENGLHIEDDTALQILKKYSSHEMSRHAKRGIDKLIREEELSFREEIRKLYKKENAVLVLSRIPFLDPSLDCGLPLLNLTFNELLNRFNLQVEIPPYFDKGALSPTFPAALVAYLNRTGDNYLNVLSRERMKWLVPLNSA